MRAIIVLKGKRRWRSKKTEEENEPKTFFSK
jgi:hypothetical protein